MRTATMIPSLTLAVLLPLAPLAAQAAPAGAPPAPAEPAAPAPAPPSQTGELPGKPMPEGAEFKTTESGLQYVVLSPGDEQRAQERPARTDSVRVRYAGYLEDGLLFDKTDTGEDISFPLSRVIPGWTEGLQLMSPGSTFKFVIPWKLAYGERGRKPLIPPKANLIFDVELLDILAPPKFELPPDAELTTTESGLKYKVLRAGDGPKPTGADRVTVNYAGWLIDGMPFDSSYASGQPVTFSLNKVIKGWTEGLQLMPVGSQFLFVIPAALGYGERGFGSDIPPNATLVFQIELLGIPGR